MNHTEDVAVLVEHRDGPLAVLTEHREHLLVGAVVPDRRRLPEVVRDPFGLRVRHRERRAGKLAEELLAVGDEDGRDAPRSLLEAADALGHLVEPPASVDGDVIEVHQPGRALGIERQQEVDLLAPLGVEGSEHRFAGFRVGVPEHVGHLVRVEPVGEPLQLRPAHVRDERLPGGLREPEEHVAPLVSRQLRERYRRLRRHRDGLPHVLRLNSHTRNGRTVR